MEVIEEDKIAPVIIDLGAPKRGEMNENWVGMFGGAVKLILKKLFEGQSIPATIKGTPSEIRSFAEALNREKDYLEKYNEYGLDNPQTYKSKYKLEQAVNTFERKTGIVWPFK